MIVYRYGGVLREAFEQLDTVQSHLAFLANDINSANNSKLDTFLGEWKEALAAAEKDGADTDGEINARISWLPSDKRLEPCFTWSESGSTWVVSKIELPWIEKLANYYVAPSPKLTEDVLMDNIDLNMQDFADH